MSLIPFSPQSIDTDVISAVCWSPTGELFTCSDDKSICRWSMSGEFLGKLCEFDAFITDIHWFPVVGKQMADIFAISCTDGNTLLFLFCFLGCQSRGKRVYLPRNILFSIKRHIQAHSLGSVKFQCFYIYKERKKKKQFISFCTYTCIFVLLGTFRIMSKTGREEKRVQAHHGAITALRWSHDGSDLVTAGEDSNIKLWSRSGMLRSTLARTGNSIYSVCWSPDNSQIVVASSKDLIIRSLDVGHY